MTTRPTNHCDRILLRRSLDDQLGEKDEESLSAHLCECDACRHELQELAGRPAAWTQVRATLKAATASGGSNLSGAGSGSTDDRELATDFAVECLEPSTLPDSIGRLGEIEVQEIIGHGGMGVVLKGYQPELKRLVAVKVLAPQLAVSAAARRRFAREAQATAAILHPNVMPILTVDSSGRLPHIVMPYVSCESLQQRIDAAGTLDLVDILRIGMQTANGLAAAHAQGLVHRDVKPANILLEIGVEKVMLTDFGLARAIDDASITRTGVIAGTPLYMSPEQSRGEAVDARSDQFSLGSVLYTLATGRTPFRAESTYGILRRLTDDTPRPVREISPQLPVWFDMIVHRLLAKQPEHRYTSASEVARVLEGCLAHLQQPATVPLPECCRAVAVRRRRLNLSIVAVIVTGVVLLSGIAWLSSIAPQQTADGNSTPDTLSAPLAPLSGHREATEETPVSSHLVDWNGGEDVLSPVRSDLDEWSEQTKQLWPPSVPVTKGVQ
ncbi:MAG: serine/threonine protein kinase [Fuerstiella sp.]|nr:serine/threonine protein kinase [Fuerstiella sp.]MCP4787279.1 serine/threonine protein kinase [Fuerstiella sp.]MCP4858472.1 serine/threonine protein kinase [Fuerstiella sp.]